MNALDIIDVKKTYKNGVQALNGVSLSIKQGDFFALLGPNGAGKTTLIGIITSLVNKTAGEVKVFGHDIVTDASKAKSMLGVVPQEFNFNIFESVHSIVLNQAGYYGIPRREAKRRAERYLKQLELWDKRNKNARSLSGGMKRRLMIARALIHEPKMLILDEPTAGVDVELRRTTWEFIKNLNEQGITIILTTHYLEEAESQCRNIAIINHGRIVQNTSMQLLLQQLDHESIILYLEKPIKDLPVIPNTNFIVHDELTLEVSKPKELGLSELFATLNKHDICVANMRNKVNRLEELFIQFTRTEQTQ